MSSWKDYKDHVVQPVDCTEWKWTEQGAEGLPKVTQSVQGRDRNKTQVSQLIMKNPFSTFSLRPI